MTPQVIIVGAGMGGLAAALRLAQHDFRVCILEARTSAGGLASGFEKDGFAFDAGPYILLDRNGLEWAFNQLGLDLASSVALRKIEDVYEVSSESASVHFHSDLEETAAGFERQWKGSGKRYRNFVESSMSVYERLRPLLHVSHPGLFDLIRCGALSCAPFVFRSLKSVLDRTGLPQAVINALSIWTHIAGQQASEAPSVMAMVPALIHKVGAYYPVNGIGSIPQALARAAEAAGVEFRYGCKIKSIRCNGGRATGVETDDGEFIASDAVVSNHSGVGTYLELMDATPARAGERLKKLPLQSPGVIAYLAVKGQLRPPYLRFRLPANELCRLLVAQSVLATETESDGWQTARLIAPMRFAEAELGEAHQGEYLNRILEEKWWRELVEDHRVIAMRTPAEWGKEFTLYRDSMNLVMTARLMLRGRLAHRSPYARGLYLAGSSTHPGQWVSFSAISGILAADCLREDYGQ
ncbi:MAG TPA: NAD(P)/FAD-dependent oxidoreductase [Blastocatellia bacterium]|jgi:phytoene dehydrogenase-like protein